MHYNNNIREDIPQHKNGNLHKHTSATYSSNNNTKGVTNKELNRAFDVIAPQLLEAAPFVATVIPSSSHENHPESRPQD